MRVCTVCSGAVRSQLLSREHSRARKGLYLSQMLSLEESFANQSPQIIRQYHNGSSSFTKSESYLIIAWFVFRMWMRNPAGLVLVEALFKFALFARYKHSLN